MDKTLRYVLEVYRQVRQSGSLRIDAAKVVAKDHRISLQAVMSACTRDVGINNTTEFDDLIRPENASKLKLLLVQRYPHNQEEIVRFFTGLGCRDEGFATEPISKLDTLFDDERKHVRNEILISLFRKKFIEWQARQDIPIDVRDQFNKWLGTV